MASEQDPWHMRLVVFIATRLIYFAIGFFAIPAFLALTAFRGRSPYAYRIIYDAIPTMMWACPALGLATAVLGPFIYSRRTMRGRGTLGEVRRRASALSPMDENDD